MISCILLAAGESKRFGSPKPLAPLGPQTVIEFIQHRLLLTDIAEIIVVLGGDSGSVAPHVLRGRSIRKVVNENFALGQASSFKTGLSSVDPGAKGVMLLPADVPLVSLNTFDLLIDTFLKNSSSIVVPTYQGKNGHPPIFPVALKEEFMALKDDEPLFAIQHRHEADTLKLPVDDKGVVLSFNTPEEFKELLKLSKLFPE